MDITTWKVLYLEFVHLSCNFEDKIYVHVYYVLSHHGILNKSDYILF